MRRLTLLFIAALLFCSSAYAAEIRPAGPVVLVDRKAGDIRVVMYMTSW